MGNSHSQPQNHDGIPFAGDIAKGLVQLGLNAIGFGAKVSQELSNVLIGPDNTEEIASKIANEFITAPKDILKQANHERVKELVAAVLELICPVVELMDPQALLSSLLGAGSCAFKRIHNVSMNGDMTRWLTSILEDRLSPRLVLDTIVTFSKLVVKTVLLKIGQIGVITAGIYSNDLNLSTLAFIWNDRSEFARFLLDVTECAKCYATAMSLDGRARQNTHGEDNEFDFSKAMNRHAITCQIQRLARSLIYILESAATATTFNAIDMTAQTQLQSDVDCELGTVIQVKNEKWFFINGIATEPFWLHLACKKLAIWSSREITGVYNRGDGILWDLIECAGERDDHGVGSITSQNNLIQRTMSSVLAEQSLQSQLEAALQTPIEGPGSYSNIVMIAHSQGCLILRLALEELIEVHDDGSDIRTAMLRRLCVFTFGNPSVNWQFKNGMQLSSYVRRTEHFANEKDFVAKLGVLNPHTRLGYGTDEIFVNKQPDWIGHLFGTQYSLDPNHYGDRDAPAGVNPTGQNSWLLRCRNGAPV
ncbi:hypothetical protein DL95DRAFT_439473 [Leptodontidium sp. 2 PMI_412]|nr:hypothetical protein DL95DRAFT_439473 [Leptodontidium sp. 2 PMI_412]